MSDEKKKDIDEMIEILKGLDKESLLILNASAQVLKARHDMNG